MESNPLPTTAIQAYRLELKWHRVRRLIIAGDRWWEAPVGLFGGSDVTIVHPEYNLLFLKRISRRLRDDIRLASALGDDAIRR